MMKENTESLNEISKNTAFALIQHFINKGYLIEKVIIDTVGDPGKYVKELENHFFKHPHIRFVVEKKADALYPIVSASSIIAKVNRDKILENWVYEEKGISD